MVALQSLQSLPAVFVVLLVVAIHVGRFSARLDRIVSRTAVLVFGGFSASESKRKERRANLHAAHVDTTYRGYASRTRLMSVVHGVAAGVLSLYATWFAARLLESSEVDAVGRLPLAVRAPAASFDALLPPGAGQYVYASAVTVVVGVGVALLTYGYRWYYPVFVADGREREIDRSLPLTVSFMYALARPGIDFPEVMRILARNKRIYGEAAREVEVSVRNIDVFGVDVVTAVETMGRRSPSTRFRELSQNLTSVLRTGGSLAEFLEREYREFREEAEVQQERLLTALSTYAEVYAAVGIALPLFGIVVLLILDLALDDLPLLLARILVYGFIPLFNLGFVLYLSNVVDDVSLSTPTEEDLSVDIAPMGGRRKDDLATEATYDPDDTALPAADGGTTATDGGTLPATVPSHDRDRGDVRRNRQRLTVYRQVRDTIKRLTSPVRTVLKEPTSLLWVSVPIAILVIGLRIPGLLEDRVLTIREFDDLLIQSLLLVVGSFAVVYEIHSRRIEAIESVVPDFLDRLASLNEAGMTIVASMNRIRRSDLGRLNEELDIIWRDIRWGADLRSALKRFERRMGTVTISRAVTLLTESIRASGDVGPVLRIAAERAKADRRLKQRRRDEMVVYIVFIYLGFLVFLAIVGVVVFVMLPNLPDSASVGGPDAAAAIGGSGIENIGQIDQDAWRLTLVHAIVFQGFCSGWLAGQFTSADVRAGAKHVTVMLVLGYVMIVALL